MNFCSRVKKTESPKNTLNSVLLLRTRDTTTRKALTELLPLLKYVVKLYPPFIENVHQGSEIVSIVTPVGSHSKDSMYEETAG